MLLELIIFVALLNLGPLCARDDEPGAAARRSYSRPRPSLRAGHAAASSAYRAFGRRSQAAAAGSRGA